MSGSILRIVARRVLWPRLREKPDRAGLRLRWGAMTEDGDLLAEATERPLADGALALLDRGAAPDALVTMRHEGSPHDSFRPVPLQVAAADALRRRSTAERLRGGHAISARTVNRTPAYGETAPDRTGPARGCGRRGRGRMTERPGGNARAGTKRPPREATHDGRTERTQYEYPNPQGRRKRAP